ncbi:hypothetical protein Golomagni_00530 [Golovinomyces magnicellulatus]|nr:hypothetical protein Golomagni_00530 [Golovinomyces magnicellulatus]
MSGDCFLYWSRDLYVFTVRGTFYAKSSHLFASTEVGPVTGHRTQFRQVGPASVKSPSDRLALESINKRLSTSRHNFPDSFDSGPSAKRTSMLCFRSHPSFRAAG